MNESPHITVTLPKGEYDALVRMSNGTHSREIFDRIMRILRASWDSQYSSVNIPALVSELEKRREEILK